LTKLTQRIAPATVWVLALLLFATRFASPQAIAGGDANPFHQDLTTRRPLEIGALVQGGVGLTQNRDGFSFLMAGVHAGKVLTPNMGHGPLRGNFEYAVEVFPFWQSYTPKFQRPFCTNPPGTAPVCTPLYTVGGTFTGASITPIILRWNFAGTRRFSFWGQAAGGLVWTNHKYPAFGGPPYNSQNDGPNADASVWNFTPQGGVGVHYFVRPRRSIDFSANGVHISSASLGDRNPGVNASVQFSLGYTWWK
jgi:lipid A 3-O-deacylase